MLPGEVLRMGAIRFAAHGPTINLCAYRAVGNREITDKHLMGAAPLHNHEEDAERRRLNSV